MQRLVHDGLLRESILQRHSFGRCQSRTPQAPSGLLAAYCRHERDVEK
jgi:hypothetical protein